jgi:UDP-N-acetylglucosamine 2-epimerase (non-hydrolysing)
MLDQVLNLFKIIPDYDLNIMSTSQTLFDITTNALNTLKTVFEREQPDVVIVQGDTTTTFAASLAAFYCKIPIAHVEAGLRTYKKYQPFPEEKNRHMTTVLTDYHFAPTKQAKQNLVNEGIPKDRIWVTGNTSIDALLIVARKQQADIKQKEMENYFRGKYDLSFDSQGRENDTKMILVTSHRRENFGDGFISICLALKDIDRKNSDVTIVYPVHLNPNVRKPVFEILGSSVKHSEKNNSSIFLIDPQEYDQFVFLMNKSYLILTDSGGVQEEAPSLGKPVLVMRETTERPEGIEAGGTKLVGTGYEKIVSETQKLLDNRVEYQKMSSIKNPFGDGNAAAKIVSILEKF